MRRAVCSDSWVSCLYSEKREKLSACIIGRVQLNGEEFLSPFSSVFSINRTAVCWRRCKGAMVEAARLIGTVNSHQLMVHSVIIYCPQCTHHWLSQPGVPRHLSLKIIASISSIQVLKYCYCELQSITSSPQIYLIIKTQKIFDINFIFLKSKKMCILVGCIQQKMPHNIFTI